MGAYPKTYKLKSGMRISRTRMRSISAQEAIYGTRCIVWREAPRQGKEALIFAELAPDVPIVVPRKALARHYVVQGELQGLDFAFLYCPFTRGGGLFSPLIRGRVHHFFASQMHNGALIFEDSETHSLWDGMTGECMFGVCAGLSLEHSGNLHPLTSAQSREMPPHTLLVDVQPRGFLGYGGVTTALYQRIQHLYLRYKSRKSVYLWDRRLAKRELGVGVCIDGQSKFYPYREISRKNVIIDRFHRRMIVVWLGAPSEAPNVHCYHKAFDIPQKPDRALLPQEIREPSSWESYTFLKVADSNISRVTIAPARDMVYFVKWHAFSAIFSRCELYTGTPK